METDIENYDIDAIRIFLEDYYGTAMTNASPFAMIDLNELDNKCDDEVLEIVRSMGIADRFYIGKRY